MLPLSQAVADYIEHIRYERRLATTTCTQYQSHLRAFLRWLSENGYPTPDLSALNPDVLRRYQMVRAKDGLRPRALRGLFHPLRGLAAFLMERGDMAENPVSVLKLPKKDA